MSINDSCIERIKLYWAKRGYDVRVGSVETLEKQLTHKLGDRLLRSIESDMVNGLPRGYTTDRKIK